MTEKLPRSLLRAKRRTKLCPTTHKQGYRSKGKARQFAERTTHFSGQKITIYKCAFCKRWHLTKQAPRERVA